jgi:uncharacterized membrane protein (DUF373 family)
VEDAAYVGLGLLLAGTVAVLLVSAFVHFVQSLAGGSLTRGIVGLLDEVLLVLLTVELLYTVQVSFREHALMPDPFLVVGLISAIRRVLVLTAEMGVRKEALPQGFVIELAVLAALILALAASLVMIRRRGPGILPPDGGPDPTR